MAVLRDTYGFLLAPLTEAEQSLRQAALQTSTSVTLVKQWSAVKPQTGREGLSARRQSLKYLVRKGIPPSMRPAFWLWLSGAEDLRSQQPVDYYRTLSTSSDLSLDVMYIVEEESRMLLRQHQVFTNASGLLVLQRLVHAYLQHNASGYVQGIGHMAAFALVVLGLEHEEDSFWLLVALLEHRLYPNCGNGQLSAAVHVEQHVLNRLVQEKLPRVHGHLMKLDCTAATLTTNWFSSACAGILPAEAAVRVWDSVITEGIKVLHRVAVALLMRYENTILSCSDVDRLKKILESRIKRVYDMDSLLQVAFKGIGSLSGNTLTGLRNKAAQQVNEQERSFQRRLEVLSAA